MSIRALLLIAGLAVAGPAAAQQPLPVEGPIKLPPQVTAPAIPDPLAPYGPCSTCGDNPGCSTGTGCDDCGTGKGPNAWIGGGYTMIWIASAKPGIPLATTGLVGAPGTVTLLGEETYNYGRFNGGVAYLGVWLNDCHTLALTAGGFMTENRSVTNAVFAGPTQTILRPFTDAVTNQPNGLVVAQPGLFTGSMTVTSAARLSGAEVGALYNLYHDSCFRADFTAGFRYLDFDESFSVYSATTAVAGGAPRATLPGQLPPMLAPGDSYLLHDYFRGRNQLYLGQMGARFEYQLGVVGLGLSTKLGMGNNRQTLEIDGTSRASGTTTVAVPGALLAVALPDGNVGKTTGGRFVVVPEGGADVSVQVTKAVRLGFGYNILFINDVVRPSRQVDLTVNPRLVPASDAFGTTGGPNRPRLTFDRDTFFAHGIRFTAEVEY